MASPTVFGRLRDIPTAEKLSERGREGLDDLLDTAAQMRVNLERHGHLDDFADFSLRRDVKLITEAKKPQTPRPS